MWPMRGPQGIGFFYPRPPMLQNVPKCDPLVLRLSYALDIGPIKPLPVLRGYKAGIYENGLDAEGPGYFLPNCRAHTFYVFIEEIFRLEFLEGFHIEREKLPPGPARCELPSLFFRYAPIRARRSSEEEVDPPEVPPVHAFSVSEPHEVRPVVRRDPLGVFVNF